MKYIVEKLWIPLNLCLKMNLRNNKFEKKNGGKLELKIVTNFNVFVSQHGTQTKPLPVSLKYVAF